MNDVMKMFEDLLSNKITAYFFALNLWEPYHAHSDEIKKINSEVDYLIDVVAGEISDTIGHDETEETYNAFLKK